MTSHSPSYRIFVSSVTQEFGTHRQEVARVLRRKELEVRDQEHFRQSGGSLLETLRAYIEKCDAVILLVGDRCGGFPDDIQVQQLGHIPGFEQYRAATGQPRASYTQWEFFLAKHYGKDTYTHFSATGCTPDNPNHETPDDQACQKAYRGWIRKLGEHTEPLIATEKLVENVLLHPFPDLSRPRPIHLPYPTLGKLFVGRDGFIADLRQSLLQHSGQGHATAIVNAVHGLGGVGKTRLAVEYAWQHQQDHSALLCITADSPQSLQTNLAALCGPLVLDLPQQAAPDQTAQLAAVLHWLQQHPGWFLILDNVDTEDAAQAVEHLLTYLHGGHILITSRISQWSGCVQPLELDVLSQADATQFLLDRTRPKRRQLSTDAADAAALAAELGGLALALEQAGAYIQQTRSSIEDYLTAWRAHSVEVQEWFDATKMKYPRSVAITWETTLTQLGHAEIALLRLLSWLAPEPIPQWMLEGENAEALFAMAIQLIAAETSHTAAVQRSADTPVRIAETLGDEVAKLKEAGKSARAPFLPPLSRLADFSMIKWDSTAQTLSLHRVVQEILRTRLPEESREGWLTLSLHLVDQALLGNPEDVRTWPQWTPLSPHVAAVATHGEAAAIHQPTALLMSNLGMLLGTKALHKEAEDWERRALAISERVLGPEAPEVATRLNNLATTLQATNRLAEAEPLMRRAMAIAETSFGIEHPNVAAALNNLAQLLKATNRLAEAEPLMRRALAIDEASFGMEHPEGATDLNNLATLLQTTNRLAEAEPLMRRALKIDEASFGTDHPKVAIRLNNLATLLQATNRLAEAEPLMRRALAIDEASFGMDHPNVARDLNNLATLLQATNRLAEAEPLMRRSLAIDEASFGKEHPNVARNLNNLAGLLKATNRQAEAEPLVSRAVEILVAFGQRTGHEHPHFQTSVRNYVGSLQAQGLSEEVIMAKLAELGLKKKSA